MIEIHTGDCREVLKTLPDASVNCCVTSPPYWGLRDYGVDGQIGLECSPQAYTEALVCIFREVRRVLRDDGTVWLNLGSSYHSGDRGGYRNDTHRLSKSALQRQMAGTHMESVSPNRLPQEGLKDKDLVPIPWIVGLALQADGWWLRADVIWAKRNCMPSSVKDRPTLAHEYILLLAKSKAYYYDQAAIAEPVAADTDARYDRGRSDSHKWADGGPGDQTIARSLKHMSRSGNKKRREGDEYGRPGHHVGHAVHWEGSTRNKRSVWHVSTKGYKEAHFATFPPDLIRPCILAGCPMGGTVLDPFGGAGTTALVAEQEGRNSVLIELNPEYAEMARKRTAQGGLFCSVANDQVDFQKGTRSVE